MNLHNIDRIISRIGNACEKRNWPKDWSNGGCYLHLEVSEFIESLRGKGDSTPEEEASDVLITLFALCDYYKLDVANIIYHLHARLAAIEKGTLGDVVE